MDLSKLAKMAKGVADKNGDKISAVVNKTTGAVDRKTNGKYAEQLAKVDAAAKKLDKTKPPQVDPPA